MELTQEQAIQLVDNIGLTLGLERHTDTMGCSYYAISNDTVVRISDHSTYLQTWVDNGTSSKPNLFSIVIEVNPSKPNPNINSDTLFKVIEYKHRLRSLLNGEEYLELINAIKGAIGNGGQFSNPFGVKKKLLCSKYSPKTDGENEQPIKESKTNKNMKTKKRTITESQLRDIIEESVKKVLKEAYDEDGQYYTEMISMNKLRNKLEIRFKGVNEYLEDAFQCLVNKDFGGVRKYMSQASSQADGGLDDIATWWREDTEDEEV